jgi:ferrous iron transport protein B
MQSFTFTLSPTENAADSILAVVATPFAYLFAPVVGVLMWQLAAATIAGFVAKENVVGTLAVAFVGLENVTGEGAGVFTTASALAFLILNLFTPPCFAAIGAMNSELKSKKWLFGALGFQFGVGYSLSFLVYFFGTLISGESLPSLWMVLLGFGLVLAFALTLSLLIIRKNREISLCKSNT